MPDFDFGISEGNKLRISPTIASERVREPLAGANRPAQIQDLGLDHVSKHYITTRHDICRGFDAKVIAPPRYKCRPLNLRAA